MMLETPIVERKMQSVKLLKSRRSRSIALNFTLSTLNSSDAHWRVRHAHLRVSNAHRRVCHAHPRVFDAHWRVHHAHVRVAPCVTESTCILSRPAENMV